MDRKQLATIAVGCAVVVLIGCLALKWASLSLPKEADAMPAELKAKMLDRFDEEAKKHTNQTIPLLLGLAAGAAALLVMLGMSALVPLDSRQLLFLACGLFALCAILAFTNPYDFAAEMSDKDKDQLGRGLGVWVTTLAAAGGAAAAYLATTKKKGKAAAKPAAAESPAAATPPADEKPAAEDKPADEA